jgi:hypothetical protein
MTDDLYRRFRKSAEEALEEADFADPDEVDDLRESVEELLDRIDRLEEQKEALKAAGGGYTTEELENQLPEDLYNEVKEHLTEPDEPDDEEAVEKAVNGDFSPLTVAYRNERAVHQ